MKKEIINNEIILLQYDNNEKIKKVDIDNNYNCVFKICPICNVNINFEEKMCTDCENELLKEEEYIYFKDYGQWLEDKENLINEMFNNITKEMEQELFNNKPINYENLKEKVKRNREIIMNKNIYVILKGDNVEKFEKKYGIENIYNINEIEF